MRMCPSRHLHLETENAALRTQLDAAVAFTEALLGDWEGDEWQIAGEWCVGQAEHDAVAREVAERRAQWAELIKEEPHE